MGLGDLTGYRKPQANTAIRAGAVEYGKALEDERELILGDTDSRLRNLERRPIVHFFDPSRTLPPSLLYLTALSKRIEAT